MSSTKTRVFLLSCVMVLLAMPEETSAQNTPQDYVNSHNTARTAVNAGIGNVAWNTTLETYALNYANQRKSDCQLIHSGGPYGENLFWGSGTTYSGIDAVNLWVAEKQYYAYGTNSCASGHVCGHYTQVVWRSSTQIGCARVLCNNNGGVFIICSYSPPGNYVGQKPY